MECGMERRFHRGFTTAEKTELWDRWKRGESLKAIGRAFGKPSSSIYFLVAPHGGIRHGCTEERVSALRAQVRAALSHELQIWVGIHRLNDLLRRSGRLCGMPFRPKVTKPTTSMPPQIIR